MHVTDRIIAAYNVNAYESGRLSTLDVQLLGRLGHGATPYLIRVAELEKSTPRIRDYVEKVLDGRRWSVIASRPWIDLNLDRVWGGRQAEAYFADKELEVQKRLAR